MEDRIAQLFDRMDSWRHLPDHQLERRVDLLFSLYLPAVLESRFGLPVRAELIPEFPMRHGTIRKGSTSNRSDKIDYLALSQDGTTAIFVKLKTDMQSGQTVGGSPAKAPEMLPGEKSENHGVQGMPEFSQLSPVSPGAAVEPQGEANQGVRHGQNPTRA